MTWWTAWQQARVFFALEPKARSIVFYAEDAASWVHWETIIQELTGPLERDLCYLTSSLADPILQTEHPRIRPFYIGEGACRTWVFLNLHAGVMVMTMPDLETFHIKRSRAHSVHYVYVFHNMLSTHMVFRRGAFDHFDTIFCVGPHHLQEIRATEARYGLPPKRLVSHGHGRLEALLRERDRRTISQTVRPGAPRRVLVAPSWGPHALLETCGEELVRILVEAGYQVTVRPHPMTQWKHPELLRRLSALLSAHPSCALETDVASQESLHAVEIMISDWSGAALEYAFAMERPVLFIDVPKKVNNPRYADISCEPMEVKIRSEIGAIVDPKRLAEVPRHIEALCAAPESFRARIQVLRQQMVFHVGSSGAVGAREIAALADGITDEPAEGLLAAVGCSRGFSS
ncbi:MAG: CDP-glycerol--glycerophosphate glycerophosphotransferase [Candidatus Omnitrophica bacterium]|nr:CDP-glycerol--glycerophosphate glycerophosphotransferase [Candidatus Omnitrophota bacterium]